MNWQIGVILIIKKLRKHSESVFVSAPLMMFFISSPINGFLSDLEQLYPNIADLFFSILLWTSE
jgi:hypothetical protein